MTQRSWPAWVNPANPMDTVQQMLGTREEDISDYFNLPNQFVGGRRVQKIPLSSADYDPTNDHIGDISYDLDYLYILISDGLVPEGAVWRRFAGAAW